MEIRDLCPGGYASACYLVTEGNTAVLVDCSAPASAVQAALAETGTALAAILLTHGHFDHMLTLDEVKALTGAPVYIAAEDADMPADGEKNAYALFFGFDRSYPEADRTFAGGDVLTFGDLAFGVLHTPGHTKGSSVFLSEGVAFTGDTVFACGYGRTDLYGGDFPTICQSLERLAALPPETVIYPGHGSPASLGDALAHLMN